MNGRSLKIVVLCFVSLVLCFSATSWAGVPGFMKARMGTLSGQLFVDNQALPQAVVSFFNVKGGPPPAMGSARRVPDIVSRTDVDGKFAVKLLPGKYYMGALIREKGKGPGPPRPGEKYFFMRDTKGNLRSFAVKTRAVSEIGRIDGAEPGEFKEFDSFITIKGKVISDQGKPMVGVLVTLKENLQSPRPKYISERTGDDGAFILKVPPGSYYAMARESIKGGRPRPGSYIGTYGKTAPVVSGDSFADSLQSAGQRGGDGEAKMVSGAKGEVISGVNINMFQIPDPEKNRQKYEAQARARKNEE